MRCVYSQAHALHAPESETEAGVQIPTYEMPRRAETIRAELGRDGGFDFVEPVDHGLDPLLAVHDRRLVHYLANAWEERDSQTTDAGLIPDTFAHVAVRAGMDGSGEPSSPAARLGYFCFDTTTPLVEGTYAAARAAADVALTTTDIVLGGDSLAYGLCRPPGHHAAHAVYGGYCFFNNAAIAAQYATEKIGDHVAILDVDYHHGNGTQQIFYSRGDVMYASLHADPNRAYPYFTGFADETGTAEGKGTNLNLPLPAGCTGAQFFAALETALDALATFRPAIVIVSLGVDTYQNDPIADFALTTSDQHEMGGRIAAACPRVVILQEGGYDVDSLGINVRAWLRGTEGRAHLGNPPQRAKAGSTD
jgi:acetoin utilization deacetylase AcuC-like enzyme